MSKRLNRVALYMRLSRDDKAGESLSIENQRIILRKYVDERGGTVIDEYVDDGWSGTNFERPDVKRMLIDAQIGKIDTIIVKDLSRFGRNYIQVGQYIDYVFPAYGIRFIAINDNVDTEDRNSTSMDMMPIMNVFNEWHAANTSKKIRAVLQAKQRSGINTSWSYPYGYKAGEDEKRTALIDEQAATIVRRIYDLRLQGHSARAIARILSDDNIPNPTNYFTKLDGGKWNRRCKPYWCPSTVADILSNPVYTGSTIQHKTTSVSYKNHKKISIPESERIVKQNAHEAIVSREIWEKVQKMQGGVSRGKADKANKVHALSGLLICPDCGKKFKLKTSNTNYKNSNAQKCGFYCRTYIDLGKKYCSSHSITERDIERVVLRDIRAMSRSVSIDEEKARENFNKGKANRSGQSVNLCEGRLKAHKSRLDEIEKLIQAAFEDRVLKRLPESVCIELCDKYQKERESLEIEIAEMEKRFTAASNGEVTFEEYLRRINKYCDCENLTRETCLQLIQFVTVGERSEVDGSREIHIYYDLKENGNITSHN